MKLKGAIAVIVLVSAFAAPVTAGTFEDAVDAHARGDYPRALRLVRLLANDGDASAQFNLGLMYTTGQGVQQDKCCRSIMVSESRRARLRPRPIQSRDPVSLRPRRDAGR
jgi:TPR repeat protein